MSQPRQFEGPDVRQLLDDIRDAYGGDEPTIARAETFRSGGVLGFFQKEQYRLTVDPTVEPPTGGTAAIGSDRRPATASSAAPRPTLVARTSTATRSGLTAPATMASMIDGPVAESDFFALLADTTLDTNFVSTTPAAAPTPDREPVAAGPSASPDPAPITAAPRLHAPTAAALPPAPAAATPPADAAGATGPGAETGPSAENDPGTDDETIPAPTASFDSILERLATILENSKDELAALPPVANGPSEEDLPPWAESTNGTGHGAPDAPSSPAGTLGAENGGPATDPSPALTDAEAQPTADDALQPDTSTNGAPSEDPAPFETNLPGEATSTDEASRWGPADPTEEATVTEPSVSGYTAKENGPVSGINPFSGPAPLRTAPQAPFGRPTLAREPSPRAEDAPGSQVAAADTPLGQALRKSGLSPELITQVVRSVDAGLELPTALTDALIGLPRAPALPRQPRSLIVVAGPGRAAIALANETAGEVGTDTGDVLVASTDAACPVPADRRIRSAQDAAALAPGYRRSGVAVVAVDVPTGGGSQAWAAEVIAALRPTLVLGIIDAVHKTEDMAAWIETIGGVDAVVIENPDATVSPASVLSLPVPVARLGHQPATPGIWVSAILDRVGACG